MATYEFWGRESRNLIESFETLAELHAALREMTSLDGIAVAQRHADGTTVWLKLDLTAIQR